MYTADHKCHGKNKTYNRTKRTHDKTVIQPQFTAKLNELTARQRQFFTAEVRSHAEVKCHSGCNLITIPLQAIICFCELWQNLCELTWPPRHLWATANV